MSGVRVRNTTVNGGLTGRDKEINKVFAHKSGTSFSTMKKFSQANQPNSEEQLAVRETLAQTSSRWSSLSQAQRDLWNGDASLWVNVGQFGPKKQSGKNLFSGCNIALKSAGKNMIEVPSAKALDATVTVATLQKTVGGLIFDAQFGVTSVNDTIQVLVSRQFSAGTSKSDAKVILYNAAMDADYSLDIKSNYIAKYGEFITGAKFFYSIRTVSRGGSATVYSQGEIVL
jgi:hypothetical protein